jgi:hypothetical protein
MSDTIWFGFYLREPAVFLRRVVLTARQQWIKLRSVRKIIIASGKTGALVKNAFMIHEIS